MEIFDTGQAKVRLRSHTFTWAAGASLSDAVDLGGRVPCALEMTGTWDAAAITAQAVGNGGTYLDLYDAAGGEVTVQTAASRYVILDPDAFRGIQKLKLRSGTTGTPVAQSAATTVKLLAREVE